MTEYHTRGVLAIAVHPGDTAELPAHATVWLVRERRDWLAGRYFSCQWDVDELLAKKQEIVDGDKLKMRMVV